MSSDDTNRRSAGDARPSETLLAFADALLATGSREAGPSAGPIEQYVTFFLRDEELGVPIGRCREIVRLTTITRVPEAPFHVRGVINLRGRIVPAVDLRLCLGMESIPPTSKSRLIVVDVDGRWLAIIVDRVSRILKIAASEIQAVTDNDVGPATSGMAGPPEHPVRLIDIDRLLRGDITPPASGRRSDEA